MRLPLVLVCAGLLAACASRHQSQPAPAGPSFTPSAPKTNQNVTVTPSRVTIGRVASVNTAGRFVVLTFPLGTMPASEKRLNVYRKGLKVGEVRVTGQPLDINIVADIVAGECQIGDEVRGE